MQLIQYFGCYEGVSIYIIGWQVQNFGHNIVNRFTKYVNRFRQQKKQAIWPMKIDTIHYIFESIQLSLGWRLIRFGLLWIDWVQVGEKHDTIRANLNRFTCDTIQKLVNRIIGSQRLLMIRFKQWWIDSVSKKMRYG